MKKIISFLALEERSLSSACIFLLFFLPGGGNTKIFKDLPPQRNGQLR